MRICSAHFCGIALAMAMCGCQQHDDIRTRYALEQELWQAQLHERRINLNLVRATQSDLSGAINSFRRIVDAKVAIDASWDPKIAGEIRRIRAVSTIALANLYFLGERYYDAEELYRRSLETESDLRPRLDARLGAARSMYLAGEEDSLETYCSEIFRDLITNDDFWQGAETLPDVFVSIPLVLVRLARERADESAYEAATRDALAFYDRVRHQWPDSAIGATGAISRVNVFLVREDWQAALDAIDQLGDHRPNEAQRLHMALLRAEILAHALDRPAEGRRIFEEIAARGNTPTGQTARFNLGILALAGSNPDAGVAILKELEMNDQSVPEIASRAMFARALHHERSGRWDEALPVLRRITRLYPHTQAASEAPLVITRHYVRTGDRDLAERSLERAREFYLELLDRTSAFRGDRLRMEDLLIENFLMAGEARQVAELLGSASSRWDDVTTVGAMFRSALVYANVLDDRESAARILQKCIELFPDTRYAKMAQRELDRYEGDS